MNAVLHVFMHDRWGQSLWAQLATVAGATVLGMHAQHGDDGWSKLTLLRLSGKMAEKWRMIPLLKQVC